MYPFPFKLWAPLWTRQVYPSCLCISHSTGKVHLHSPHIWELRRWSIYSVLYSLLHEVARPQIVLVEKSVALADLELITCTSLFSVEQISPGCFTCFYVLYQSVFDPIEQNVLDKPVFLTLSLFLLHTHIHVPSSSQEETNKDSSHKICPLCIRQRASCISFLTSSFII